MILNPENQTVTDYKNLLEVDFAEEKMTYNGNFNPTVPVYELDGNSWKQTGVDEVQSGDILLFAGADTSDIVWAVRIIKGSILQPEFTTEPSTAETTTTVPVTTEPSTTAPGTTQPSTAPSSPSGGDFTLPSGGDITIPSGGDFTLPSSGDITMPSGGDFTLPSGGDITMLSGGDFTFPSGQNQIPGGGFFGGSFGGDLSGLQSGLIQNENRFELFDLEGITLLSVIPGDTMTVTVSVDEIDLNKIEAGMKAEITLDAFIGESFSGVISDIGTNGKYSGGNSKFSVEITMDKAENMLVGMNATAKITLALQKDVLTVPVEALCDIGNETVIYTKYDKGDGALKKPVTVTVGASDGKNAQILSGLDEGDEYYYSYYDEYQKSEDSSGFGGMGGFGR